MIGRSSRQIPWGRVRLTQDYDSPGEAGFEFWVEGEFVLRIGGAGRTPDRTVRISRPYALVGHGPNADVRIHDQAVSAYHTYLHLDRRGLYAIDLLTRTGTRFSRGEEIAGWLTPGDWIEVGGRRIELVTIQIDGHSVSPAPCQEDPLAEVSAGTLLPVTLDPERRGELPWDLGSELIFVGRSTGCAIQLKDESIAKVHGAFVRTPLSAYLVDLCGRDVLLDGQPIQGAALLQNGQTLALGSTHFRVQLGSADVADVTDVADLPHVLALNVQQPVQEHPLVARVIHPEIDEPSLRIQATETPSPEPRDTLFAWMIETFREGQNGVLKQQAELQNTLAQLLQKMQQDNATLLSAQLARMEAMDREIASLRSQLSQQASLPGPRNPGAPALPSPPPVAPLKIAPREPNAAAKPMDPTTTASWILERVSQLEDISAENPSAWREWLSRLSPSRSR